MNMIKTENVDLYLDLYSVSPAFFNKCFYCGCEATHVDYVPPLKYALFYIRIKESADFYKVPACYECTDFLRNHRSALLQERMDILKKFLEKKYKKAITIFESWTAEESTDLDYNLKKCVDAGIKLGGEACERLKFRGFKYEVDGQRFDELFFTNEEFSVFGEKFDMFRDALDFASKSYRIPKSKLKELFADNNNSFDNAIRFFHKDIERKAFEKDLKEKCKIFSDKYKQNIKFVMRAVELYMSDDNEITIDEALNKLHAERIKC